MSKRTEVCICVAALVALLALPIQGHCSFTINLESDVNTEAYYISSGAPIASDVTTLDAGPGPNNDNLTASLIVPVDVGAYGTFAPLPAGAPPTSNPQVVNIPTPSCVGDSCTGNSGFFLVEFTLPADFTSAQIVGVGNVDDLGTVFLNGTAITNINALAAGFAGPSNVGFSATTGFVPGTNWLVISDDNAGGGPSGAAFWATVTYDAPSSVPEPSIFLFLGMGLAAATVLKRMIV